MSPFSQFELGFGMELVPITELYYTEVARFKILSLPWFESYVNLYRYFYSLLEICCWHFLSMLTTKLQLFMKQQKIYKVWKQPTFQIPVQISFLRMYWWIVISTFIQFLWSRFGSCFFSSSLSTRHLLSDRNKIDFNPFLMLALRPVLFFQYYILQFML